MPTLNNKPVSFGGGLFIIYKIIRCMRNKRTCTATSGLAEQKRIAGKGQKMFGWLKTKLGEAYTDEIDKKLREDIGKAFIARDDFNAVNAENKKLKETVGERDEQLENLKKETADVVKGIVRKVQE